MNTKILADRLAHSAKKNASRSAVFYEGKSISYSELFAHARGLANHFNTHLASGAPVGILCQGNPVSLVGVLAAVLSGRPYVPLNPKFPNARLEMVIHAAKVAAIVCDSNTISRFKDLEPSLQKPALSFSSREDMGPAIYHQTQIIPKSYSLNDIKYDPHNISYIMFTSGTTGLPKGVKVTDSNVCAYLDNIQEITSLTNEDRCSHFFDLSFDLSVHDMFVTWVAGAELVLLPSAQAMELIKFIGDNKVTAWFSVPSTAAFAARLGHLKPNAMPSLRLALFCGEALPVTLAKSWMAAAPNATTWNIYGPTEATIAFTAYKLENISDLKNLTVVPLGFPLRGQHIRLEPIADEADLKEFRTQLLLGGTQVTPGYINNPEQNASRFFDETAEGQTIRWYRTGDIATQSEEFGLLFGGRIDDQIKINGYRVELMEIETVLRNAAGTQQVCALATSSMPGGALDQIIAYVCGAVKPAAEIRKLCKDLLPVYMVPRKIIEIEEMPVTTSGKIDRNQLRTNIGVTPK